MTRTTKTTCDHCNKEILSQPMWPPKFAQSWTVIYECPNSEYLNQEMHFCIFECMMDYLMVKYKDIKGE